MYGWIDICVSSIYMYAVRFIFVRLDCYLWKFDLYVCGSIYFCTAQFIFAVLILNERVSLYLCAFNIGCTRFEDFVRNGTP